MTKKISYFIILLFVSFFVYAQNPVLNEHIRIPLWAEMESIPGIDEYTDNAGVFDYAVKQIKKISPFLMEGMVYGWDFVYTPSDKEREVNEYFELIPKVDPSYFNKLINYENPWIEDNKLYCWCEYFRTESENQYCNWWNSINHPNISGYGYGALIKGFDGIQEAVENAAKSAIREYYRGIIKNKPKEISGEIFIKNIPSLGLDAGRYLIKLDFLLEKGKITEYQY